MRPLWKKSFCVSSVCFQRQSLITVSLVSDCVLQVLTKQTFLCMSDYDEPFDFHCLHEAQLPSDGMDWYTVCGTPVTNRAEYVIMVSAFVLLGLWVYGQLLACSGLQPSARLSTRDKHE